jgi:hypothetical protein
MVTNGPQSHPNRNLFFLLKKKTRETPPPHPILFYFILFFPQKRRGEKSGHPQAEIFWGPWAGGQISHLSKLMLAIRNYTPHTIHGHKSHPNKKLFKK